MESVQDGNSVANYISATLVLRKPNPCVVNIGLPRLIFGRCEELEKGLLRLSNVYTNHANCIAKIYTFANLICCLGSYRKAIVTIMESAW